MVTDEFRLKKIYIEIHIFRRHTAIQCVMMLKTENIYLQQDNTSS